jgi:uncharacterized protein with PIN domain
VRLKNCRDGRSHQTTAAIVTGVWADPNGLGQLIGDAVTTLKELIDRDGVEDTTFTDTLSAAFADATNDFGKCKGAPAGINFVPT